ncbi:MAG: hypothetical protein RLZZ84_1137 [Pseudomonadota bacterium]|jgi:hypothetical protein
MVRIANFGKFGVGAIGLIALGLTATPAQAAGCGIRGSATATPAVYDPFNRTGLPTTTITLNLTRENYTGGGDTRYVAFYLRSSQLGADGTSIVPIAIAGSVNQTFSAPSLGLNIFHDSTGPFPAITPADTVAASSSNRIMKINFTGNNAASDTAQVTFNVTLPAGLDLRAINQLAFDAYYGCIMQGGTDNGVPQTGMISNAVVFPIKVLSALRTYYAGTALDFGEIGMISTASLPGTPVRTGGLASNNYIAIQSTGAYTVAVTSANNYKLNKPGATVANDRVDYKLYFLGQQRTPTNPSSINISCKPATLAGEQLPIEAELLEGGEGKNPSPLYSDTLTVTVTPMIYSDPGVNQCSAFTVP